VSVDHSASNGVVHVVADLLPTVSSSVFVLLPNHNVINCAFHRAGCVSYQLGFLFRKQCIADD